MSTRDVIGLHQSKLRSDAEHLIEHGKAPRTHGWIPGVEVLALLHGLASSPASANDALKLLHELQVHQVELDLQKEQLEQSRQELAADLDRYVELFDLAPMGYFNIDDQGRIVEGNLAGARLFGVEREQMLGRPIASFLAAESRPLLADLLSRLRTSGARQVCTVRPDRDESASGTCQVVADAIPGNASYLLVIIETAAGAPDVAPA